MTESEKLGMFMALFPLIVYVGVLTFTVLNLRDRVEKLEKRQ